MSFLNKKKGIKFRKGEIVPYSIVERKEKYYNMVVFGCDVEVVDSVIYPTREMRGLESLIVVRPGVKETVRCNCDLKLVPRKNK